MSFSKKEQNTLKDNGWKLSSTRENTYVRGNETIKRNGNETNFNGSTRNYGISNSLLNKKSS